VTPIEYFLHTEENRPRAKLLRNGAPGEIRTPDLLLRRQSLYPAELRARQRNYTEHHHVRNFPPPSSLSSKTALCPPCSPPRQTMAMRTACCEGIAKRLTRVSFTRTRTAQFLRCLRSKSA
jgi:hypothetical protein